MILVIDNYDSFTYNLVQYFGELGADLRVIRNDEATPTDIRQMRPAAVVLSPGPCTPAEAGCTVDVIHRLGGEIPILGICLGHQAIGHAFGATVRRGLRPVHGKTMPITHDGAGCFQGVPNPVEVCRYNSLVVDPSTLPAELIVTATSPEGEVMGLRHRHWPIEGLQFHPESIFTQHGMLMLRNFLESVERFYGGQA